MAEALSQAVKDLAMQLGYVDDTAALLTHMLVCMLVVYIVGSCILGLRSNQDFSHQYCKNFLASAPAQPPDLAELEDFLLQRPMAQLPISPDVLQDLPASERPRFHAAFGISARAFAASIWPPSTSVAAAANFSEHITLLVGEMHVVAPLMALDRAARTDRIGLEVERNLQGDSASLMTVASSTGVSLRPSGVLRDLNGLRMLAKWEDKGSGHDMLDALKDLKVKTASWTPLYYGNIKYLPCFAAVGQHVQFAAVTPMKQVVTISRLFDSQKLEDRVDLLFCCIQFYKLLKAQRRCYPDAVLPLCRDIVAVTRNPHTGQEIKRTLYFCSHETVVRKRIDPWQAMEAAVSVRFDHIAKLYQLTATLPGLVHAVEGPFLQGSKYTVTLAPIGRQGKHEQLREEEDVRRMAHGLLHGLAAIHGAGFVYRDLRVENTACTHAQPRRWFLLDLECCALPNQAAPPIQTAKLPGVLVGSCFTPASDIAMLGKMLQVHAARVTSAAGEQFLAAACIPAEQQMQSAEQLLTHPWLACSGPQCKAAGAQPGERAA